jgi:hypothetical protein
MLCGEIIALNLRITREHRCADKLKIFLVSNPAVYKNPYALKGVQQNLLGYELID